MRGLLRVAALVTALLVTVFGTMWLYPQQGGVVQVYGVLNWTRVHTTPTPNTNDSYHDPVAELQALSHAHTPDVVFYNRMRKTGSETTSFLFQSACTQNHVTYTWDWQPKNMPPVPYRYINDSQYQKFINRVLHYKRPSLFIKHLYFVDFSRYVSSSPPVYINIARDPISRKISEYNYLRFRKDRPHSMSKAVRDMSMDECITSRHAECYSPEEAHLFTIMFCGIDPVCQTNSTGSYQLAKRNIASHFAVVGLLERMRETMAALECALPRYFRGLLALYDNKVKSSKSVRNRTPHKTVPSEGPMSVMRSWYSREYDLFDWITQRFDNQIAAFKLKCPHLKWSQDSSSGHNGHNRTHS